MIRTAEPLVTTKMNAHLQTLKQMENSSRRSQWVLLLLAKNSELRLQFTPAHQNWITEDWKSIFWSDESFCCNTWLLALYLLYISVCFLGIFWAMYVN